MKDVYFKDEGDFMTVGFVSDKAKFEINKELGESAEKILYGEDDVHKIDLNPSGKKYLITWCISHDLGFEDL